MTTLAQTAARRRIIALRRRQTAFNGQLNQIVHRLREPGDTDTDTTPDRWTDLWASWDTAEIALQAIVDGLAAPAPKSWRMPVS